MIALLLIIGMVVFFIYGGIKLAIAGVGWVVKPVLEENNVEVIDNAQTEPLKVEIKQGKINTNAIIEYQGEEIKQFEFRPQTFSQFISQEKAKARAKIIMRKARQGIRSHFLIDGIRGHGKTTFIELLGNSLGAKIIQRIGKQIDEDEIINLINEINGSSEDYVMLFIDEIDTMDWKILKIFNPIIEQFKINGKKIKPFIFAGATISKHILQKNNPDTLDRIPAHIKFERYTIEDIAKIIKQYKEQLYSNENVSEEIINKLSKNSKFNPRTSIALLEDYIVMKNIRKVLYNNNIIKDGLTNIDVRILETLNQATRPIGANALAMKCKLNQNEYVREFESFLVEYNYIDRIPSRIITNKGKLLLKELNEQN